MIIETRERVNGYRVPPCTTDGIGDWEGEEEQAARQFVALCEAVAEALPNGQDVDGESEWTIARVREDRQGSYETICSEMWDIWGSDPALLTVTPAQMAAEARRRAGA